MYCYSVILSVALALCSTGVVAVPAPQVTAAPLAADLAKRATSCTFSGAAGAAAASKSKASCVTIVLSSVAVPSGTTLDLTGLKAGTHVVFEGTTTFGYKEWAGPLVSVAGTDIVVTGAAATSYGHRPQLVVSVNLGQMARSQDGGGSRWWDGEGTNGGKTKPKFFYAHKLLGKSSISNINIKNSPVQVFSINGASGLTLTNVHIDNTAGDSGGGHNTDCFDVGSSDNVSIVVNGVVIENSKISNSQNGVRIKTVSNASGAVKNVSYKGITLSGITKYGIVIEQDYLNGGPTGSPTSGVPITGLTISGVTGSVASSATDVYILCASGACSGWTWSGNSTYLPPSTWHCVTGGKVSTACKGLPSGVTCSGK
ncbi:hypothetical protein LTR27_004623 [Elasticomyces elasticus]|nr:hypothetical protein LTR27_004623 [Elasticomyces elasticus]